MQYKSIAARAVRDRTEGWDKVVGVCHVRSEEYRNVLGLGASEVERIARVTADNYPDLHDFERVAEASFLVVAVGYDKVVLYARYLSSHGAYVPVILACHSEPGYWNKGRGPERFMHVPDREHVSLLDALRAEE